MEYWIAFTIGLLGSLHCIGMCGPIAFALPLNRSSSLSVFTGSLIYNLGRITSYTILGLFFGLIGKGLVLAGFQQWLSISVGISMIISVLLSFLPFSKLHFPSFSFWLGRIKASMSKQFGKSSNSSLLVIGLLNGLLPCGLVYIAIAGAIAMSNPLSSGAFMFLFGLGTVPIMFAVVVFGTHIKKESLIHMRKAIPFFIVVIGTLFILRGMNLGIPYVSPDLNSETEITKCH